MRVLIASVMCFLCFFNGYSLERLNYSENKSKERIEKYGAMTYELYKRNPDEYRRLVDEQIVACKLSEVFFYIRSLSDAEIDEVRNLLADKWKELEDNRKERILGINNYRKMIRHLFVNGSSRKDGAVSGILYYLGYSLISFLGDAMGDLE